MSLPDLKTALKNVPHATQDNCDVTYEKNSGLNKKSGGVRQVIFLLIVIICCIL